jgi:hypothetical protein
VQLGTLEEGSSKSKGQGRKTEGSKRGITSAKAMNFSWLGWEVEKEGYGIDGKRG